MRILPLIAALSFLAAPVPSAAKTIVSFDSGDHIAASLGDYLAARFAAGNHDYAEAAKLYQQALSRDPENPQLLTYAFFYAASAGEVDDAAKLAERLVVATPDDRAARLTLAIAAMKRHDYKKAREEIAKSAKGPFTSFTVALIDGWAAAGAGDAATARADFKQLHAQKSADGLAYFNEGMLAELLGDKDGATAAYLASIEASGPTPRVIEAYGKFLERNGRAAEAKKLYERAAEENGYTIVTTPGLARIAAGQIPDAFAPRAEDGAAEALFGIASSLNDEANRDISVLYLQLALHLNPKLDLATILLANRCEALGKFEDAIAAYEKVSPSSPFYRMTEVAVAVDYARLDKSKEAIARLEKLSKAYPNDLETWTALGDSYRAAKRYDDAVNAYNRALSSLGEPSKKSWPLLYARAVAEQETGRWEKAEADLQDALKLSPNEPDLLNYLGYSWVDQKKNVKEALTMLEKARALSPQNGYIIDSVGWAYYRLGRFEDAVDALEDAVQLVPGDPTINDHLGDAYWKVGRKLDATFQWSHALAFGPDAGEKAKIEKKLKTAGE
ncbi:tetratricopeptide repeat protein [Rhizomicrobium electricum]|uniref:Tetratricopeptide repeat protein n=1 Tax=Rhizomicrobium electricum TaxID=480070 RepID=A0ABN1E016_9PROT|nr:tetratricopeptide repeat protein [Rhizomicrobium electricum]NIJ47318.1 tetratricopeptide (TPR) repeat protein [Rhizomicrobium electricum]